jgi:hypothetical protein
MKQIKAKDAASAVRLESLLAACRDFALSSEAPTCRTYRTLRSIEPKEGVTTFVVFEEWVSRICNTDLCMIFLLSPGRYTRLTENIFRKRRYSSVEQSDGRRKFTCRALGGTTSNLRRICSNAKLTLL